MAGLQLVFTAREWTAGQLRPQCGSLYSWSRRSSVLTTRARLEEAVKTAVVVGGGWAGFGAAYALTKLGLSVTVLDASPSPGGLSTGFCTAQGRLVSRASGVNEHVGWCRWQYHNIYSLLNELNIVAIFSFSFSSSCPHSISFVVRGLSQEKALVTGLLAANAAASSLGVNSQVEAVPVEENEAHIAAGKSAVQGICQAARSLGIKPPFL